MSDDERAQLAAEQRELAEHVLGLLTLTLAVIAVVDWIASLIR